MNKVSYEGKVYALTSELLFNDAGNYEATATNNGKTYAIEINGDIDPDASDEDFRNGILRIYEYQE